MSSINAPILYLTGTRIRYFYWPALTKFALPGSELRRQTEHGSRRYEEQAAWPRHKQKIRALGMASVGAINRMLGV